MMFQDIIMAAFGVLILIVLFLLFNLQSTNIETKKNLEKRLLEVQAESKEQHNELSDASQRMRELLDVLSEAEMAEIDGALDKKIRAELKAINEEHEDLKAKIAEAEEKLVEETEALESHQIVLETLENRRATKQQLRRKHRRIATIRKKRKEFEKFAEDRLLVQPSTEFERYETLYFAELVEGRIAVNELRGDNTATIEFATPSAFSDHVAADSGTKHVMLFVRPSGVELFSPLQRDFRRENVPLGYQPLAEDKELAITGADFEPPLIAEHNDAESAPESSRSEGGTVDTSDKNGGHSGGGDSRQPPTNDDNFNDSGNETDSEKSPTEPNENSGEEENASPTAEDSAENNWNLAMLLLLFLIGLLLLLAFLSKRSRQRDKQ